MAYLRLSWIGFSAVDVISITGVISIRKKPRDLIQGVTMELIVRLRCR